MTMYTDNDQDIFDLTNWIIQVGSFKVNKKGIFIYTTDYKIVKSTYVDRVFKKLVEKLEERNFKLTRKNRTIYILSEKDI